MKPEDYVAIMRAMYELQQATTLVQVAQQNQQRADVRYSELLRAQGLDPTTPHRYSDKDFTIEPLEAQKAGGESS